MRLLINIILIVILLHFIIKSINYNKTINILDNTMNENFHTNVEKETGCYKKLYDYVKKCKKNKVKPGNYYVENENTANFSSNVLNVNKFYDRNLDVDVVCDDNNTDTNINNNYTLKKIEDQTCFPKRNLSDQTNIAKPDNWNYKNELPMNGGNLFNGVVGFDTLNTGFSIYNDENVNNMNCQNIFNCNVQSDDIRFGLGYPNQEYRDTR